MKMRGGWGRTLTVGLLLGIGVASLMLVGAGVAVAQTAPANLAFEVATVKPSPPLDMMKLRAEMQAGRMPRFGPHVTLSQAEYTYMPLKNLIAIAFNVKPYQISGPPWLATERFDIVAKMPDGASKDDAPRMLQSLLEERFKLAAHRDNQERPVLGLVVGKDGPKLKPSLASAAPIDPNAPLKPGERQLDGPDGPIRMTRNADGSNTINMGAKGTMTQRMDPQSQTITLESSTVTMAGFADMLTNLLQMGGGGGRQVVDMTGLKGNYQVAVEISMADAMAAARAQGINVPTGQGSGWSAGASPAAAASDPGGGSSVFGSVQKLGLKLEPRKAKVEQLVIDNVERTPTEN